MKPSIGQMSALALAVRRGGTLNGQRDGGLVRDPTVRACEEARWAVVSWAYPAKRMRWNTFEITPAGRAACAEEVARLNALDVLSPKAR